MKKYRRKYRWNALTFLKNSTRLFAKVVILFVVAYVFAVAMQFVAIVYEREQIQREKKIQEFVRASEV